MDKDAVQQANKVFQDALASFEGGGAKAAAEHMPQSLAGIDLGSGNLCAQAPKIVDSLLSLLKTFSWFIPDKVEGPATAFLTAARDVILPAFCGAAAKPMTKDNITNG